MVLYALISNPLVIPLVSVPPFVHLRSEKMFLVIVHAPGCMIVDPYDEY